MTMTDDDWYPGDAATERELYGNIDAKVDGYAVKYPVLTHDYTARIHAMCGAFIESYDKLEQNRATAKQMTTWFTNIVRSRQKDDLLPSAPIFQPFNMPAGATLGLEQQCRGFARLMKSQPNYDKADGLDLMIEKGRKNAATDFALVSPELKQGISLRTVITEWKKLGFDALELQYRKAGTEMWQLADKSTERIIEFTPPLTLPDIPEKFEFRAIYILKNLRVGQWSPIYTLTVS